MNADLAVLIKLLTGPHQGAELVVEPGRYIVGSSQECDIIISDVLVQPKHLEFEVQKDRATVKPLANARVFVDGEPIAGDQASVAAFHYITIGSTYFTFGTASTAWPPSALRPLPRLREGEPAASVVVTAMPKALPGPPREAEIDEVGQEGRESRLLRMAALMGFLVCLSLAVGSAVWPWLYAPPAAKPVDVIALASDLRQQVKATAYGRNLVVDVAYGRITVTGSVPTEADMRLLYELANDPRFQGLVAIQATSAETLIADAESIFNAFRSSLNIVPNNDGELTVTGFAGGNDSWERLRNTLRRDLPSFAMLKFDVLTADEAVTAARRILARYHLLSAVSVKAGTDGLVASGKLPLEQMPYLQQALIDLQGQLPLLPPVDNQVQPESTSATAEAQKVQDGFEIDTIRDGLLPWLSTANGKRFFAGAILPNGWTIADIGPDGVDIRKNQDMRTLTFGQSLLAAPRLASPLPGASLLPPPPLPPPSSVTESLPIQDFVGP
jgi:type III secretion system YscD/HrpQ family protein